MRRLAMYALLSVELMAGCSGYEEGRVPLFNREEPGEFEKLPDDLYTDQYRPDQTRRFNNGMIILMNHYLAPVYIGEQDSFFHESLATDTLYHDPVR